MPRRTADPATQAAAIVRSLGEGLPSSEDVFAAFAELDGLPIEVVRDALTSLTGPAPDPERLDLAMRRAHGFPPPALHLIAAASTKDADVLDLPVGGEQLRAAGKAWDGLDLEPEERLDGENDDSFAGTLEHLVLVDAADERGGPLFDLLLVNLQNTGLVFRAGTAEIIGAVADGIVEVRDRRLREAVEEVIARRAKPEPEPLPARKKAASKKKTATKKTTANTEKPAKRMAPKKKTATKKTTANTEKPAKKTAPKKKARSGD